jgi:hypothetical protein
MQTTIDDQGKIEIPRTLRDRLHLVPGAVVDLEPAGGGFNVTPALNGAGPDASAVKLLREGTLLVLGGREPASLDDVNRALDAGRSERLYRIVDDNIETQ